MLSRFPAAFRPPACASWAILFPLGSCAFLTVGRPGGCFHPDPNGVATFHTSEIRPGWVLPLSRGGGVHPDGSDLHHRRLPLLNGQPCTPLQRPIGGAWDHETSPGVHSRSPVRSSPDLWLPDGTETLGSQHLSFAPHRYRRRTSGWGRVHGH